MPEDRARMLRVRNAISRYYEPMQPMSCGDAHVCRLQQGDHWAQHDLLVMPGNEQDLSRMPSQLQWEREMV